jgi:hypothetical protein
MWYAKEVLLLYNLILVSSDDVAVGKGMRLRGACVVLQMYVF